MFIRLTCGELQMRRAPLYLCMLEWPWFRPMRSPFTKTCQSDRQTRYRMANDREVEFMPERA